MNLFDGFLASKSNQENELIYEQLAEILDNEQALTALLSRPRDAVTQRQKKALNSLARYYQTSGGDGDDEKVGEEERYIKEALAAVLSIPRNAVTQPQREVLSSLVLNTLARHFGVSSDEGVDEEETQNNILLPVNDIVSSDTHKSSPKSQRVSPSSYNLRSSEILSVEDNGDSVREEGCQNVARRAPKRRRISPSSLPSFTLTGSVDQGESQADFDDLSYSPCNSDNADISEDTDSNIDESSTDLVAPKRPPRHLSSPPHNSRQGDTPDNFNDTDTDSNIHSEGPSTDLAAPLRPPRHPWSPVLRMTSLSLDPIFQRYLTDYGPDPERFLNDHGRLIHKVGSFSYETRGDAFMACYQYAQHLECRPTSDKVRWCFSMLNFYDVIQISWPGRGRIGHGMVPELLDYFGLILGAGNLDPEKIKKDLNDWFCLGCKLNFLCEHFGPGCFFYLGHILSHSFVKHRLTKTKTYQDAHAQLTRLGLKAKALESGANQLGEQIRDLLIKPFKEA